ESVYRQSAESVTKQRLSVVESVQDVGEIESRLGMGVIEELMEQAEDELKLIAEMEKYRPWEPLEEKPPAGQWDYFRKIGA
ncbi:hypothetical protein HK097_004655, partial [Rhizophlyctis rosea]